MATPTVNILQEILMAVFLPLMSARVPYMIKPMKLRVSGST